MKTYTLFHSFKLTLVLLTLSLTVGISNAWGATYTLVTNTNQLSAGDEIIIANATEGKAIGTTQNTNNRAAVSVTITNDKISNPGNTVQIITLETSSTNWKFKVGTDSYLYAASNTSNHLKSSTATTAGANGVWSISISSSNATISATGTNSHNKLKYNANNGNPIFSCYTTGENLRIYKKVSGYSITYHCNGATSDCPSNASGQTALPNPLPTPTRTGCTFAGWYTNEGFTTAATAGATLAADADLYAKWTCNVTLNRNGATETINNVVVGTALDDIDGASAQGGCSEWTFEGWSKTQRAAQNNSTAMDLVTTVDGPGPYYAVYSHTESGGGNSTASSNNISSTSTNAVTLETGKPITYKCSTSNEYSNPARIYKNNTITIAGATITSISLTGVSDYAISNMTVNTGTLSTSGDNGTWEGSATSIVFTASSAQTRISAITVTYTGGSTTYYSTTASCCTPLGQINGSISLTQLATPDPTKLKATWAMNAETGIASYTLEVYNSSNTLVKTINNYTSGSEITGLTPCTEYYVKLYTVSSGSPYCEGGLIGTSSSCTTNSYNVTFPTLTGTTKLTGSATTCASGNYVATFEAANEAYELPTASGVTVTIGGSPATSGTDYTWAVSESVGTLTIPTAKQTGDITIAVVSIAHSCSATPTLGAASLSGAFSLSSVGVSCAGITPGSYCAVKSGNYGFIWYEGTASDKKIGDTGVTKVAISTGDYSSGSFSTALSSTFVAGNTYTFRAFATNTGDNTGYSAESSFTPRSVTFNSNGGSAVATAYVNSGSTVSQPSAPTRTGYDFVKWQLNGADYSFSSAVSANITLDAVWSAKSYTVTFDQQSGSGGSENVSATYDADMPSATMPTRSGYTFGGYYGSEGGAGTQYYAADGSSAHTWDVANATTLYAKWTIKNYTVTWKVNGADYTDGEPSDNANYNTKVTDLPDEPTIDCGDKSFVGWTAVSSSYSHATDAPTDLFTTAAGSPAITDNTTFYAVFAEVEGSANEFTKVTDASTLADGDNIIIVSTGTYRSSGTDYTFTKAMKGKNSSANYFDDEDVTISTNTVTLGISSEVVIYTLQANSNNWKIYNGENYLVSGDKLLNNGISSSGTSFSISITSGNATISDGTYSLQYNPNSGTNSRFACYSSTQKAVMIFRNEFSATNYSTSCGACNEVTVSYTAPSNGNAMTVKKGSTTISSGDAVKTCSAVDLTVTLTPAAHYLVTGLTATGVTGVTVSNVGNVYTVSIPADKTGTLTLTPTFTPETPLTINFETNGNGTAGTIGTIYSGDNFDFPNVTGYDSECVDFFGWVDATGGATFTGDGSTHDAPDMYGVGDNSGTISTNKTYKAVFGEKEVSSVEGYLEVTSEPDDWSGTYLIVYKAGGVVFNGSLSTLDAAKDTIKTTIISSGIVGTSKLDNATFTIAKSGDDYTIQSASGKYIGRGTTSNGIDESSETAYTNSISKADGSTQVVITGAEGYVLRYNSTSDQSRFRYYNNTQNGIHLYKAGYVESVTYTYTTTPSCGTKYMVKLHGEDVANKNMTGGNVKYNGGTRKKFIEGDAVTIVATAATGYTFTGWTATKLVDDSDVTSTLLAGAKATTASTSFTMQAYEVDIEATFTQNNYTVTVTAPSNGSITAPTNGVTKHYGDEITVTLSPNTGYEVTSVKYNDGSDHAIALTNNSGSFTMPDADVTISATIALATYTLSYDLDEGSVATPNPTSYNYTASAITLNNPTKTGYTFTGWSGTGLVGENNMTVTIPSGSTGDRSYTAHWEIKTYTVTWLVDGEAYTDGSPTTEVNHGSKVTTLPDPPGDDELGDCADSFVGWSTTQVGSTPYAGSVSTLGLFTTIGGSPTITENTTFYAVFGKAQ